MVYTGWTKKPTRCNLLLMACFAYINVSQGSVETYARCSGIFDIHLTANFPRNLLVKKNFLIRLGIDRIMIMSLWPVFLAHSVYLPRYTLRTYDTIRNTILAANPSVATAAVDQWDRQTDERTDTQTVT